MCASALKHINSANLDITQENQFLTRQNGESVIMVHKTTMIQSQSHVDQNRTRCQFITGQHHVCRVTNRETKDHADINKCFQVFYFSVSGFSQWMSRCLHGYQFDHNPDIKLMLHGVANRNYSFKRETSRESNNLKIQSEPAQGIYF